MANATSDEKDKKSNDELEEIKLKTTIAEAKKKLRDAENALNEPSEIDKIKQQVKDLKEILPSSEVKPLEGKIVATDVIMESQILAYKAMSEIAFQISKEINNIKKTMRPNRVIICNQDDFNAISAYNMFIRQIELFKKQSEQAIKPKFLEKEFEHIKIYKMIVPLSTGAAVTALGAAVTALGAAPAISKSLIDIISLFRKNIEIKGKNLEIKDEALIAEVARALNSLEITTIYQSFINKMSDKMIMLEKLSELFILKEKIDQKIKEFGTKQTESDEKAIIECLSKQCEKILKDMEVVDEKSKINRFEILVKGEMLSKELDKDNTDILYLKVIFSGGNNKTTQSLFQSGQLSHNSGVIITYFLLSKEGDIKASKTFYNVSGYKKFKCSEEIAKLNNFEEMLRKS